MKEVVMEGGGYRLVLEADLHGGQVARGRLFAPGGAEPMATYVNKSADDVVESACSSLTVAGCPDEAWRLRRDWEARKVSRG